MVGPHSVGGARHRHCRRLHELVNGVDGARPSRPWDGLYLVRMWSHPNLSLPLHPLLPARRPIHLSLQPP